MDAIPCGCNSTSTEKSYLDQPSNFSTQDLFLPCAAICYIPNKTFVHFAFFYLEQICIIFGANSIKIKKIDDRTAPSKDVI